jgi:hypothetical protein
MLLENLTNVSRAKLLKVFSITNKPQRNFCLSNYINSKINLKVPLNYFKDDMGIEYLDRMDAQTSDYLWNFTQAMFDNEARTKFSEERSRHLYLLNRVRSNEQASRMQFVLSVSAITYECFCELYSLGIFKFKEEGNYLLSSVDLSSYNAEDSMLIMLFAVFGCWDQF